MLTYQSKITKNQTNIKLWLDIDSIWSLTFYNKEINQQQPKIMDYVYPKKPNSC